MTKIASPFGWITRHRRKDGTIVYRLRAPIDGRVRSIGLHATIGDALEAAELAKAQLAKRPTTETVGSWIASWLDDREKSATHRSVKSSRALFVAYVEGAQLSAIPLRELRSDHVRSWLRDLSRRHATTGRRRGELIAEQTQRNALRLLSVALRDAVEAGKLRANPCVGLRVQKRARMDTTWHYLTAEEVERVLALPALKEPGNADRGIRPALVVAIFAGLRAGELWGLRWTDVHLDGADPHLVVRRSYAGPTKGGKPRIVPLLPPALDALKEWREHGGVTRVAGPVWPRRAKDRKEIHAKGYQADWPRWREAAGLRDELRFHDLRHTCAAHLISGTWGRAWRLEEVQRVLGHASRTTTERYAHLAPDALAGAIREARGAWQGFDTRRDTGSRDGMPKAPEP